jgi:hypothetical protein
MGGRPAQAAAQEEREVTARARIAACLLLASFSPCAADPAPAIHYAPAENLEHVDVALIDRAEREIDMAAYVLTDWAASVPSGALAPFPKQPGELSFTSMRRSRVHFRGALAT